MPDDSDTAYVAPATVVLGPTTRGRADTDTAIATSTTSEVAVDIQQFVQSTGAPPGKTPEVVNAGSVTEVSTGTITRPISSDARVSVTGHDVVLPGDRVPYPTADEVGLQRHDKYTTFNYTYNYNYDSKRILNYSISYYTTKDYISRNYTNITNVINSFTTNSSLISIFYINKFNIDLVSNITGMLKQAVLTPKLVIRQRSFVPASNVWVTTETKTGRSYHILPQDRHHLIYITCQANTTSILLLNNTTTTIANRNRRTIHNRVSRVLIRSQHIRHIRRNNRTLRAVPRLHTYNKRRT